MARNHTTSPTYLPTSVHLSRMFDQAESARVSIDWLIEQLGTRSFGLTLFVMALIAFLPGAATIVGLLIAWPAIQMILGHKVVVLPRLIARRDISVDKLARAIRIVTPRLEWVERLIRPRWPTPFRTTKRLTGMIMLLLALAYLEEDGIALLVALIAALLSLAVTATTVWGVVETADWLDPVRPQ